MLISKYVNDSICDKIRELELKYGITLSQDYKSFLIKYNGGDTPKTKLSKGEIKTDIRRFYGFTVKNKHSDLQSVLDSGLGEEMISGFRLPIATNSFGDYFLIRVSKEKNGEISFVYHDKPQGEYFISSSFSGFISLCKSENIGHIRSIEERKQCLMEAGKGDKITQVKIDNWQKEIDKYAGMNQEEVLID